MKRTLELTNVFNKRLKKEHRTPLKIIGGDPYTRKWLVEFTDLTRQWMSYDYVQNLDIFREFIEIELINRNMFSAPRSELNKIHNNYYI